MNLDKLLDVVMNKFHMVLGAGYASAILGYHFWTGHDIPSGIQNASYAYYAFLGGHFLTSQKFPDAPAEGSDGAKG